MNEFDQCIKHTLKVKFYIRYADDFAILSRDKNYLMKLLRYVVVFLGERLKLELHPDKVFIETFASGVDFFGWVHFPDHRVLRAVTKKRILKRIQKNPQPETVSLYRGLLKYGNTYKIIENSILEK